MKGSRKGQGGAGASERGESDRARSYGGGGEDN